MNQPALQLSAPHLSFTQLFSSTRRGARLARLLTVSQLRSWSAPQGLTERVELVVAELAANAVLHGHVPGRSFRLTLVFDAAACHLQVDVTDPRGDRWPQAGPVGTTPEALLRAGGRGLALVDALTDHWETLAFPPSGKTVRAELTGPT